MFRLILAVATAVLVLAQPAQAQFSVQWTRLTSDPVVTITSDQPVECSLGNAPPEPCSSPWRPAVGADGVYSFLVESGAVGTGGSFTLDRTPPQVAFTSGPAEGAGQTEREATIEFISSDAHPDTVECRLDEGAFAACDASFAVTGLADGEHAVTVRAVDQVGNATERTRRFSVAQPQVTHVDTAAPRPNPVPVADGEVLSSSASRPSARLVTAKRTRGWTLLRTLTIRDVTAGTAIKATCVGKGNGCPKRALRVTATRDGSVSLNGLTGRRLRPGTAITITLTRRGEPKQTIKILIRSTRAPRIG